MHCIVRYRNKKKHRPALAAGPQSANKNFARCGGGLFPCFAKKSGRDGWIFLPAPDLTIAIALVASTPPQGRGLFGMKTPVITTGFFVMPHDVINFNDKKEFIFCDTPPYGRPSSQRGTWVAKGREQISPLARGVRCETPGGVVNPVIEFRGTMDFLFRIQLMVYACFVNLSNSARLAANCCSSACISS